MTWEITVLLHCPDCRKNVDVRVPAESWPQLPSLPDHTCAAGKGNGKREGKEASLANFVAMCNETLEMLPDIPEKGTEFAASVESKLLSMIDSAIEHNGATDGMVQAAENMRSGVEKWLR